MYSLSKIMVAFMALAMMVGLGCSHSESPKVSIIAENFDFKVSNLSVDDGKLFATGGTAVNVNWTVNIIINGQTSSVSISTKSDELPVRVGNEMEIGFTPACAEQTEAIFTLPDGTTRKLEVGEPALKWNVPENFMPGMEITGETTYETDDCIYKRTGTITLIALE